VALLHVGDEASSTPVRWRLWAWLGLILTLASVLRLAQLGGQGLWSDECLTANWAGLPWGQIGAAVQADNNAPLFFYLEKLSLALFGNGEAALRLLPALVGIVTVGLIYWVGRTLLSARAGLLAAFLLAISPMHVYYSREGRNYVLLGLLCLLVAALGDAVRVRPSPARVTALSLLCAAILYTHPIGAFYVAGILAAVAFVPPAPRRSTLALATAACVAAVAFLPWLPRVVAQAARVDSSFHWAARGWHRDFPWQLVRSFASLTHGSLAPVRSSVSDLIPSAWAGLVLVLLLVTAGLRGGDRAARNRVVCWATAVVLPLAALFLYSWARSPVYVVGRIDSPLAPLFMLLVAAAAEGLPASIRRWLPVTILGLAILPLSTLLRVDTKSQERSIIGLVRSLVGPRELLVSASFHPCLLHYGGFREGDGLLIFPPGLRGAPDWLYWWRHGVATLPAEAANLAESARRRLRSEGGQRLWVLSQHDEVGTALATAFEGQYREVGRRDLGFLGTDLRCYVLPPAAP
jgi:4-amino-4-deoxy-L-arabinose transferase-like glycosyltransferase